MDITVALVPVGNTTEREIAALKEEVQDAVRRVRGVEDVVPGRSDAPEGAKGLGEEVGAFLVGVPPNIISGVVETVRAVLTRAAQPHAEVEITAQGVKLKFDPRHVSLEDMAGFVERIRPNGNLA